MQELVAQGEPLPVSTRALLHSGVTRMLPVQDKKRRLYLVCAAADTRVDLKGAVAIEIGFRIHRPLLSIPTCPPAVLGVRLGLPKPGMSFAPEDMLQSILQVNQLVAAAASLHHSTMQSAACSSWQHMVWLHWLQPGELG